MTFTVRIAAAESEEAEKHRSVFKRRLLAMRIGGKGTLRLGGFSYILMRVNRTIGNVLQLPPGRFATFVHGKAHTHVPNEPQPAAMLRGIRGLKVSDNEKVSTHADGFYDAAEQNAHTRTTAWSPRLSVASRGTSSTTITQHPGNRTWFDDRTPVTRDTVKEVVSWWNRATFGAIKTGDFCDNTYGFVGFVGRQYTNNGHTVAQQRHTYVEPPYAAMKNLFVDGSLVAVAPRAVVAACMVYKVNPDDPTQRWKILRAITHDTNYTGFGSPTAPGTNSMRLRLYELNLTTWVRNDAHPKTNPPWELKHTSNIPLYNGQDVTGSSTWKASEIFNATFNASGDRAVAMVISGNPDIANVTASSPWHLDIDWMTGSISSSYAVYADDIQDFVDEGVISSGSSYTVSVHSVHRSEYEVRGMVLRGFKKDELRAIIVRGKRTLIYSSDGSGYEVAGSKTEHGEHVKDTPYFSWTVDGSTGHNSTTYTASSEDFYEGEIGYVDGDWNGEGIGTQIMSWQGTSNSSATSMSASVTGATYGCSGLASYDPNTQQCSWDGEGHGTSESGTKTRTTSETYDSHDRSLISMIFAELRSEVPLIGFQLGGGDVSYSYTSSDSSLSYDRSYAGVDAYLDVGISSSTPRPFFRWTSSGGSFSTTQRTVQGNITDPLCMRTRVFYGSTELFSHDSTPNTVNVQYNVQSNSGRTPFSWEQFDPQQLLMGNGFVGSKHTHTETMNQGQPGNPFHINSGAGYAAGVGAPWSSQYGYFSFGGQYPCVTHVGGTCAYDPDAKAHVYSVAASRNRTWSAVNNSDLITHSAYLKNGSEVSLDLPVSAEPSAWADPYWLNHALFYKRKLLK